MNYFEAAETVLYNVPQLIKALKNLEKREQRLVEQGKPDKLGSINLNKPFITSHDVNDALSDLLEFSECSNNKANTQRKLDEINCIVEQLKKEYKQIITLWYFDKETKERIMEIMKIESSSTVYNLRNKAVAEFALLYYGAAALP